MSVFRSLLMSFAVISEPDIYPYLLARKSGKKFIKLMASKLMPLYYLNTPQILENTLDNKNIGTDRFSFSFKINKSSITDGTKYILNYPGLIDVKSENNTLWFKFLFEENSNWKYIDQNELIDDWNSIVLSSNGAGVIILVVNSTTHTLIDSNVLPTYRWFSGFSDSSYILPNDILEHYDEGQTTGEISSYEHTIKIRLTALGVNNQGIMDAGSTNTSGLGIHAIRWTVTTDGFIHYRVSSNGGETYSVNITGTEKLPLNTDILCNAIYHKTIGYSVKHSIDGGNTWVVDGTSSVTTPPYTLTANGWKTNLGDNIATGLSLQGSIDLAHTVFKCNGKEEFNGATAVESDTARGNAFIVSGTLTEDTDKQEYPTSISTGKLVLVQPWTVLKDVEAQLLGSVEPPAPVDPDPEPTYDDEGAPVLAKDLPKGWAMWKCIVDYEDAYNPNSNWYRYTTNIPYIDDENTYHGSGEVYSRPDKNSPAATATHIYLGSPNPGTSQWEYYTELTNYNYYEVKLIRNRINE